MAVWRYAGTLDDIWAGEMRAVNLGAVDVLPGVQMVDREKATPDQGPAKRAHGQPSLAV